MVIRLNEKNAYQVFDWMFGMCKSNINEINSYCFGNISFAQTEGEMGGKTIVIYEEGEISFTNWGLPDKVPT